MSIKWTWRQEHHVLWLYVDEPRRLFRTRIGFRRRRPRFPTKSGSNDWCMMCILWRHSSRSWTNMHVLVWLCPCDECALGPWPTRISRWYVFCIWYDFGSIITQMLCQFFGLFHNFLDIYLCWYLKPITSNAITHQCSVIDCEFVCLSIETCYWFSCVTVWRSILHFYVA